MKKIAVTVAMVLLLGVLALWLARRSHAPARTGETPGRVVSMVGAGPAAATQEEEMPLPGEVTPGAAADAGAAFRKAMNRRDPVAAARAAETLGRDDPLKAMALLDEVRPDWRTAGADNETKSALGGILTGWVDVDATGAAEWSVEAPASVQAGAATLVANAWARVDPEAAADWVRDLQGPARDGAATIVALRLAAIDPPRAIALAEVIGDEATRDRVFFDMSRFYASLSNGLAAACAAADRLGDARYMETVASTIVSRWKQRAPERLADWLVVQPPGRRPGGALGDVLQSWAETAAQDVMAWAAAQDAPETRQLGYAAVGMSLVDRDLEQALALAEQLDESAARAELLGAVSTQWAAVDPAGASAWLQTLPAGISRDAAILSFVDAVYLDDTPVAMTWLAAVGDTKRRDARARQIMTEWLATGPDAVRAWVEEAPITQDMKQVLLAVEAPVAAQ